MVTNRWVVDTQVDLYITATLARELADQLETITEDDYLLGIVRLHTLAASLLHDVSSS